MVNERHGLPLVASPEAKKGEETHDGDTARLMMSLRGGYEREVPQLNQPLTANRQVQRIEMMLSEMELQGMMELGRGGDDGVLSL